MVHIGGTYSPNTAGAAFRHLSGETAAAGVLQPCPTLQAMMAAHRLPVPEILPGQEPGWTLFQLLQCMKVKEAESGQKQ